MCVCVCVRVIYIYVCVSRPGYLGWQVCSGEESRFGDSVSIDQQLDRALHLSGQEVGDERYVQPTRFLGLDSELLHARLVAR